MSHSFCFFYCQKAGRVSWGKKVPPLIISTACLESEPFSGNFMGFYGWKRKPPPGPFARARAGAGGAGERCRACAVAARRCRRGPRRVTPGQRSRVTSVARRDWLRARGAVAKLEPRDGAGRLGSLAAATCAGGVSASPRRGPRCSSWTPGGAKPAPESARAFPVA